MSTLLEPRYVALTRSSIVLPFVTYCVTDDFATEKWEVEVSDRRFDAEHRQHKELTAAIGNYRTCTVSKPGLVLTFRNCQKGRVSFHGCLGWMGCKALIVVILTVPCLCKTDRYHQRCFWTVEHLSGCDRNMYGRGPNSHHSCWCFQAFCNATTCLLGKGVMTHSF